MPVSSTTARVYIDLPEAHLETQSDLDEIYAGIKAAKVRTVRIRAPWNIVQPTNATTYTWVGVDRAVNRALLQGITPIIVLAPPRPTWAAREFDPHLFAAFAKTAANRYRPSGRGITRANRPKGVAVYQMWDIPNTTSSGLMPYRYVDIIKKTYPAIKKVVPNATVMLGSLQASRTKILGAGQAIDPVTYLNRVYDLGGRGFFDAVAYNPLSVATNQVAVPPPPSGTVIAESDAIRNVMRWRGDRNKPMHWTSVGYDTDTYTDLEQACYLESIRRFAEARKDHIAGLGIYTYQDPGGS